MPAVLLRSFFETPCEWGFSLVTEKVSLAVKVCFEIQGYSAIRLSNFEECF